MSATHIILIMGSASDIWRQGFQQTHSLNWITEWDQRLHKKCIFIFLFTLFIWLLKYDQIQTFMSGTTLIINNYFLLFLEEYILFSLDKKKTGYRFGFVSLCGDGPSPYNNTLYSSFYSLTSQGWFASVSSTSKYRYYAELQ